MSSFLNSILNCKRVSFIVLVILSLVVNIDLVRGSFALNLQINPDNDNKVIVKNHSSYIDSNKNFVVVGSMMGLKNVTYPLEVVVGLPVFEKDTKKIDLLTAYPYNKILYYGNEPTPFKFIVNSNKYLLSTDSVPIIYEVKNIDSHFIKVSNFQLNYSPIIDDDLKELHGNVTNNGLTPINNLTLYAIVNDEHGNQIDSVKTFIAYIKPKQTANFAFIPDAAIKDKVSFYSCVGGNLETMKMDSKQFINLTPHSVLGYRFSDLMELKSLDYSKNTNQFKMDINNIYPLPNTLNIEIMPSQKNTLAISIDGSPYNMPKILNTKNSTLVNLIISQGYHQILINGFDK